MSDGASAAVPKGPAVADPLIGRVIHDRFRIIAVLARGGMGKIYRAEQLPLGRPCALKVLSPNATNGEHNAEFHRRFFLEASVASKLTHPNTITVFDYGRTEDDVYFMAMEFLEGQTLQKAIRSAIFFPERRALHIAQQICRAVREAHGISVIHRDLKPANIFLVNHGDEEDFVKVLDFGLVKDVSPAASDELTRMGVFVGSPKYMAPEQVRGGHVDVRTDIYALGTILYEMLAGRVPFARSNSVQTMVAQLNEAPPPLQEVNPSAQVSPALEAAVFRCLAKDPDQRFASMDDVLAALKHARDVLREGAVVGSSRSAAASGGLDAPPESHAAPEPTSSGATGSGLTGSGPTAMASTLPSGTRPTSRPRAPEVDVPIDVGPVPASASGRTSGRRFGVGFVAVGLGVVAAAGATLYLTTSRGTPSPAAMAVETVASEPHAVAPPEPSAAPAPEPVKVRVNSDPGGAEVRENSDVVCQSTPCDIPYSGDDADPSRMHKLTLTLPGYRAELRSIRVGDSPVVVRLTKTWDTPRFTP